VRGELAYLVSLHRWSDADVGGSAQVVVQPRSGQQFILEVFGWKGPRRLPPDMTLELLSPTFRLVLAGHDPVVPPVLPLDPPPL